MECKYEEADFNKLKKAEKAVIEKWLEEVYGSNANLEGHLWIEKVKGPSCKWFNSPIELRKKLFEQAKLEYHYGK